MKHSVSVRQSTLGYCSPVRFLEEWLSKHGNQQSMAARERSIIVPERLTTMMVDVECTFWIPTAIPLR